MCGLNWKVAPETALSCFRPSSHRQIRLAGYWAHQEAREHVDLPQLLVLFKVARGNQSLLEHTLVFFHSEQ